MTPCRSYRIFDANLTLANSSSNPSALNTGSKITEAMRFGSPRLAASPSAKVSVTDLPCAAPAYGSSALMRGLPSRNDCLSRAR